ncbi:esterase-like activity of phytase family protein [Euhalothece natronophila Z-M001]|uniref:Esterase-like activity of phytase family protein n=1 Tax=Euhalothece natronophila Z-M001 TaxID=522448 RepID=A0A5B8NKI4_9CHRO|nr:esterase-like activity of phytase family protein [Euhalothece natronophila]QDZ39843.1 esterase-like activity of phytase family protein [Euhalothece natronophila Z-M001]
MFRLLISCLLLITLTACSSPSQSQAQAQERVFPDVSVEFLDGYEIPKQTFKDTPVGGLSGITYNPSEGIFYTVSDDRSRYAPARFYTLDINFNNTEIEEATIKDVTFLKTEEEEFFDRGTIDAEGIAFAPGDTVFISSEGNTNQGINPFIRRFDIATGKPQQNLRLPKRFLLPESSEDEPRGVRNNLGFESLTINPSGVYSPNSDSFRVFTATESSLAQDQLPKDSDELTRIRFLHYVVNSIGPALPIAEHLYLLDESPLGTVLNGLTELLAIQPEGYFLSLERTYGLEGYGAKLFLVAVGNATDTSGVENFNTELGDLQPLRKKELLDFSELDFDIYNLEGLALGPRLADGSQSLLVISDDNFRESEPTQLLLFRLNS